MNEIVDELERVRAELAALNELLAAQNVKFEPELTAARAQNAGLVAT